MYIREIREKYEEALNKKEIFGEREEEIQQETKEAEEDQKTPNVQPAALVVNTKVAINCIWNADIENSKYQ